MMNRRDLFKALAAVSLSLPELAREAELALASHAKPAATPRQMSPTRYAMHFNAGGMGEEDRACHVMVRRRAGDWPLFGAYVNAMGGTFLWRSGADCAIYFPNGEIPIVEADALIDWAMPLLAIENERDSLVIGSHGGRYYEMPIFG